MTQDNAPDAYAADESPPPQEALESGRLRRDFVAEVSSAVRDGDVERVRGLVEPLHPADLADLVEMFDGDRRLDLIDAIGDQLTAEVIAELNDWVRDVVLEHLPNARLSDVVGQLDTDDAVALLEDLEIEDQQEVLREVSAEDRLAIEQGLSYPEDSAGRIMQRELVAVPDYWSVGQLIDFLRENSDLTTDFWEIFVVDPSHKPIGTVQLSWLLRTPRDIMISDIMQREQTLIKVDEDQEDVALTFQKYSLVSAAVINASGRLVGVITVDDILHVMTEEVQEDILKMAGAGEGDINEPLPDMVRSRVTWLLVNLATAVFASFIIALFEASIQKMVALAILMPIVASMGGNAGTQTMAVAVRALATNQLTGSNAMRIVWKEFRVALINGLILATVVGVLAALYFGTVPLGLVIAAAMVINVLVAGLSGVLVPLGLDRLKVDPAVASSVFVTMATDVFGFLAFLGLATAVGLADMS